MRRLVTRFVDAHGHGWYVGDGDLVLDARWPDTWPGTFQAFLRLGSLEGDDVLVFASDEEKDEFAGDVEIPTGESAVDLDGEVAR